MGGIGISIGSVIIGSVVIAIVAIVPGRRRRDGRTSNRATAPGRVTPSGSTVVRGGVSLQPGGATLMCQAVCLNCGALVAHQSVEHVKMAFETGAAASPDYVVLVDGVEVHRCCGPVAVALGSR